MEEKLDKEFVKVIKDSLQNKQEVNSLPPEHEMRKLGKTNGSIITHGINILRSERYVTVPEVRQLMSDVWNILNNNIVRTSLMPAMQVQSLSFLVTDNDGVLEAIVITPEHYAAQYKEDPLMQFGALVSVGSKVRDFYNGMFECRPKGKEEEDINNRALAYEVEFLLMMKKNFMPSWVPNEYQKQIMEAFPDGMKSFSPEIFYTPKPTPPEQTSKSKSAPQNYN